MRRLLAAGNLAIRTSYHNTAPTSTEHQDALAVITLVHLATDDVPMLLQQPLGQKGTGFQELSSPGYVRRAALKGLDSLQVFLREAAAMAADQSATAAARDEDFSSDILATSTAVRENEIKFYENVLFRISKKVKSL